MSIRAIHRAGACNLLVDLDGLDAVLALNAALDAHPVDGQRDVLAAAQTVMISFATPEQARQAATVLPTLTLGEARSVSGKLVRIPVIYDGEDLQAVAEHAGLSREAVINAHTGQRWTAAFGGFAPGFAYLVGENQTLSVPRRSSPRTRVPAGSVALAGDYSAVYPRQSPGGWQLLGHTDLPLWDLSREHPALVQPQDTVIFSAVTQRTELVTAPADTHTVPEAHTEPEDTDSGLRIIDAGLQSLLQDAGRPGLGNLGVPVSGAADPAAYHQANRLVGNRPEAPVIENLTGRMEVRAVGDQVLAVTGAQVEMWITPADTDALRQPRQAAPNRPFALLDGERLRLEPTGRGLRSYLAVRGDIALPATLGSLSTDTLSGLGPAPLRADQLVPVRRPAHGHIVAAPEPSTLPVPDADGVYTLRVTGGPRDDWFGSAGWARLTGQEWTVSSDSNRVGVRLNTEGAPLQRVLDGELASEGVARGALQVPPSGLPVLFLADHPVTGGYPVIATLLPADLSAAAQLPPGSRLRFALATPAADHDRFSGHAAHA